MLDKVILRLEEKRDYREVENITREAFWNLFVPGCNEHYLVHTIRGSESFIPELDFVAEYQDKVVGNIVYTKAIVVDDSGKEHNLITFGPVSVAPLFQGKGVGKLLINYSIEIAKSMGFTAIAIYGDPDYYKKYGFVEAEKFDIGTSQNFYIPALQVLELKKDSLKGIHGRFVEDKVYEVDEEKAELFDKQFPIKEKIEGSDTQIKFMEQLKRMKPRAEKS